MELCSIEGESEQSTAEKSSFGTSKGSGKGRDSERAALSMTLVVCADREPVTPASTPPISNLHQTE